VFFPVELRLSLFRRRLPPLQVERIWFLFSGVQTLTEIAELSVTQLRLS